MENLENVYTLKEKLFEIQRILDSKPPEYYEIGEPSPEYIRQQQLTKFTNHGFGAKYFDIQLNENQRQIFKQIHKDKQSFYLCGGLGRGKTALLQYIGKQILLKYERPSIRYTTSNMLIQSLRNNDKSVWTQYLFIDDLGFESFSIDNLNYLTDFMRQRYMNSTKTFIGSNLKFADLQARNEYYYQLVSLLSDSSFMQYYELKGANLRK